MASDTQPLIPLNPHSIQLLDILLPPLLLGLALIIHDIQAHRNSNTTNSISSHVFTNQTHHARLLPATAKHHFHYHLVQFGLDLDQLESGQLDVPHLFRFIHPDHSHPPRYLQPSSWLKLVQIFSISPSAYHSNHHPTQTTSKPSPHSIKLSLLNQLQHRFGIQDAHDHVGKVYLLSMPTYLGFTPINPLSIYFCYEKPAHPNHPIHPPLKYVVLDVQNTFDERHSYLLTVGLNESPDCPSAFQHEWMIPRAFHVSPFNDRSGFYKVSISDPFSNTEQKNLNSTPVKVNVKVVLQTSSGEKKFFASLHGVGAPLTKTKLIRTWINFPIILFLTTMRILYQSFILHLGPPRLNVYPKPDPLFDLDHASKGPNQVQSGASIGATAWQEPDWCSRWSKKIVLDYLKKRVDQIALAHSAQTSGELTPKDELTSLGSFENITNDEQVVEQALEASSSSSKDEGEKPPTRSKIVNVVLKPADQTQEIIKISPDLDALIDKKDIPTEDLIIHYSSASFFSDLILFPTPSLAQLICDSSEGSWKVSSIETFDKVFENPNVPQFDTPTPKHVESGSYLKTWMSSLLLGWIISVRSTYLNWQLSFITLEEQGSGALKNRSSWFPPPNFFPINQDQDQPSKQKFKVSDRSANPIDIHLQKTCLNKLVILWFLLLYLSYSEKFFFFLFFFARFVPLTPPWLKLKRAIFLFNHYHLDRNSIGSLTDPS